MILGITGHQKLHDAGAWPWVRTALGSELERTAAPLVGYSSLAVGADQLFAELVLKLGGELRVVLPFAGYEEILSPGSDLDRYQELLGRAARIEELPALATRQESYMAAGQRVVDRAERVIAVWNGKEAAGLGGTGDVVRYALATGKDVLHINPVSRAVRLLLSSRPAIVKEGP
jgi:hypothetical protein